MEQVVLKPQNLPKQLRLLGDSPPAQDSPSICIPLTAEYETHPVPGNILEAIRMNVSLKHITMAEFTP